MKLKFYRRSSEKSSWTRFHQNSSSGSRTVPCGQTDIRKLTVVFRSFLNAPKSLRSMSVFYDFLLKEREKYATVVTFHKLHVSISSQHVTLPLSHVLILMMGSSWLGPVLVSLKGACPIVGGWRAWRRWGEVESPQSHSAEGGPASWNLL